MINGINMTKLGLIMLGSRISTGDELEKIIDLWELTDDEQDIMMFPDREYISEALESTKETIFNLKSNYKLLFLGDSHFKLRKTIRKDLALQVMIHDVIKDIQDTIGQQERKSEAKKIYDRISR